MIPPRIKALFRFIEFLHSNIKNFKKYDPVFDNYYSLRRKQRELRPSNNFSDNQKFDELEKEIEKTLIKIERNITTPVKNKAIELKIYNPDEPETAYNWNNSEIEIFKKNFSNDDLPEIFSYKDKYTEYRTATKDNALFAGGLSIDYLDRVLKDLFSFFNEAENSNNKALPPVKEIEQVSSKFSLHEIPFREQIESNHDFKNELFRQYNNAPRRPCFKLFTEKFFTDEEIKGFENASNKAKETLFFVKKTESEKRFEQLNAEFSEMKIKNEVPEKYLAPDIEQTVIVRALRKIDEEYNLLKNSILNDIGDPYERAKNRAENINEALKDLGRFAPGIVDFLKNDNENSNVYTENKFSQRDFTNVWKNIKSDFNTYLKVEFLIPQPKTKSLFSVLEWATIFYYADETKLLPENRTIKARIEQFINKYEIDTTIKYFRTQYYEAKKRINEKNDYPINKLELIIPFLKKNYKQTVTKVENDIIFLEENKPEY